jgi:hypothetical protein
LFPCRSYPSLIRCGKTNKWRQEFRLSLGGYLEKHFLQVRGRACIQTYQRTLL